MAKGYRRTQHGYNYSRQKYPFSVFKPIAAGFFREKVTIQRPVNARPDGQGGVNQQWADLATVWARIQTINDSASGNIEKFEEMQIKYQQHFSVMIRYGGVVPIDTSYRLLYTGPTNITQVLQIIAVVDLDVLRWQMNLYCREGGNIG